MKKIYFLLMTMLVATIGWSKTTTWVGGANTAWDNPANWDNGIPANNDIVIFPNNTTSLITRVAQGGNLNLASLSILGGSSIRLVNTSGARTITISNGLAGNDFIIESGAQLSMGTNINITLASGLAGNPTGAGIDGVLLIENNRTYDSDNNNVLTSVDGIIQNSGTVTGTATRLSFAGGSQYIHARNGGILPLATWNSASTCSVEGIINSAPGNVGQMFGNFTWNSPSQSINFNFAGTLTNINGTFTVASTGPTASIILKNFGGGTTSTTVLGDYIQTGGKLFLIGTSESHNLNIRGNFEMTGGLLTRSGASGTASVNFSGTTVQSFTKTAPAAITNQIDFRINNNAKVDFGTSVLSGSTGTFTLASGGKIITANANGLDAAGSIQMTRVFSSGADYEFQGPATGVFTTSTPNTVRDLIINNTVNGEEVVLDQPLTVSRTLHLTAGVITTTSNLLSVGSSGTTTPALVNSFVNGPLAKVGTTAFTFPVGKLGEGYRTIGISAPSGNATFRAEFFRSNPSSGTLGAGITQISACEYWDLARTGGGAGVTAQVTLSWESVSPCGGRTVYVTDPTTLRVAHLVGSTWVNEGRSSSTGDNVAGTVTSQNAVATFSPFALASSTILENPLPVLFANVKAYEKNNGVQIDWSNLTEKDVANYAVERSSNGTDFSSISQQSPTSNQNDKVDYSAFDANPVQGMNYYRVKATETTGKTVYSKILSVSMGGTSQSLRLYPNPVKGNQVTISMSNVKRGQYTLRVINTAGQDIFRQSINNQSSSLTQTLDLPSTIKAGVYNLVITGGDYRETKTFIVQ